MVRATLIALTLTALCAAQDRPAFKLGDVEQKLFDAANESRAKETIDKLRVERTLCAIARKHAENMARQEKMDHVLDGKGVAKRTIEGGYDYRAVGENLAKASGPDPDSPPPTPAEIHDQWMKSDGHRANLMNPKFKQIGLAVVKSEKGTYYYCQVFATPLK
ncbi:MAG: CAP domain-containing protein [Gemmataceae bacterium]